MEGNMEENMDIDVEKNTQSSSEASCSKPDERQSMKEINSLKIVSCKKILFYS